MASEPMSPTATVDPAIAIVNKAMSRIGDIATLPIITSKIIEIVENPKSTARDLHEVIKNDPALSSKVLKVVNSAFYGLPGQIASVDRAIVLLGLSAVKNIAIASSIARLFRGDKITDRFSAKDLWTHSVAVAVAARKLTQFAGLRAEAEEIFLAGLIHDLGILIERQAFGDKLAEVVNRAVTDEDSYLNCEQQVFGTDHQKFGEALAIKWKFPRHLKAAIGWHHDSPKVAGDLRQVVAIVQVADILCSQQRLGFYLTAFHQEMTPALLHDAGLTTSIVEQTTAELEDSCREAETLLMG